MDIRRNFRLLEKLSGKLENRLSAECLVCSFYGGVRILEQWGALLEDGERILEHLAGLFEHLRPILEDQADILELPPFIRT